MWGRVRGELQKNLVKTILFSVVVWFLHTFILVYLNEGFVSENRIWSQFINVKGLFFNSMVMWSLIGGLLPLIINFFKNGGHLSEKIQQFAKFPNYIISLYQSSGGGLLSALCFVIGGSLFINRYLTGLTGIALGAILTNSLISFLSNRGSFFINSVRLIAEDVQMTLLQKKSNLSPESMSFVMGVFSITMLLAGLLETILPWMVAIWQITMVVMFVLGFVFYFQKHPPKNGNYILILFLSTAALTVLLELMFPSMVAFADDGGWKEAGGSFKNWIRSPGALESVLRGLPPAIAAALANLLANMRSNLIGGDFSPFDPQSTEEDIFQSQEKQIEELRKLNREQLLVPQEDGSIKPYVFDPKTGVYRSEDGAEFYTPKDVFGILKDWNRSRPQKLMVSEGKYIEIVRNEDSGDGSWLDAEGNIYRGKDVSKNFDLQTRKWLEKLHAEDVERQKRLDAEDARIAAEKAEKERLHQVDLRKKIVESYGLPVFKKGRGGPGPHSPEDYIDYTIPHNEKILRKAIKKDIQAGHMAEAKAHMESAAVNDKIMNIYEAIENVADVGVEYTAKVTGTEKYTLPIYYGAKGFAGNVTESVVNDKSFGETLRYGIQGASGGVLKGAASVLIDTGVEEQFQCRRYINALPDPGSVMERYIKHNGKVALEKFGKEFGKNIVTNLADNLGKLPDISMDNMKQLYGDTVNSAFKDAATTTFVSFGLDTLVSSKKTGRLDETVKRYAKKLKSHNKQHNSNLIKYRKSYKKILGFRKEQAFDNVLNTVIRNNEKWKVTTGDLQSAATSIKNFGSALLQDTEVVEN